MTNRPSRRLLVLLAAFAAVTTVSAQEQVIQVPLTFGGPGDGKPTPNFSPKGMQVPLTAVTAKAALPPGAQRPAKQGVMKLGPDQKSWLPVLATASAEFPKDLCQIYLDRNRNGNFSDDGEPMTAKPSQNAKTKAWSCSTAKTEISIPYAAAKSVEPYVISVWTNREDSLPAPDLLRFSNGSWRQGTVTINGVDAVVAAMDADNNAIWDKEDTWSILGAAEKDAAKLVLNISEARPTERFMFVPKDGKDIVLAFRSFSPDGRTLTMAVLDKPINKLTDRAPDDLLRDERPRPRATVPFAWSTDLPGSIAKAKAEGKKVLVDFETTWCGPCHTMDQWIWTDMEVAAALNKDFIGVKLDGDIEKAHVKTYGVAGYPTMLILDGDGKVLQKVTDYLGSKQVLELLKK